MQEKLSPEMRKIQTLLHVFEQITQSVLIQNPLCISYVIQYNSFLTHLGFRPITFLKVTLLQANRKICSDLKQEKLGYCCTFISKLSLLHCKNTFIFTCLKRSYLEFSKFRRHFTLSNSKVCHFSIIH